MWVATLGGGLNRFEAFDVVLMDCQMPEMSGFEATRRIRKLGDERADVPVIALTASASDEDRELCLAAGMNDFLGKPIQKERLRNMIVKWLGDPSRAIHAPGQQAGR